MGRQTFSLSHLSWQARGLIVVVLAGLTMWLCFAPLKVAGAHPLSAEQAREARKKGYVLSLRDVVKPTLKQFPGKLLKAVLTHKDEQWVYTLIILQEGGYITKARVNAQDGTLINHQSRKRRGRRHRHENFSRRR